MTLVAELLRDGKISFDECMQEIISGYLYLEAAEYEGMKNLMASTRCCVVQAQASVARNGLDPLVAREACYQQMRPKLESQFPGRSRLVFDDLIQRRLNGQRDERVEALKAQQNHAAVLSAAAPVNATEKRKRH